MAIDDIGTPAAPPRPLPRSKISDAAAAVAQHTIDLETLVAVQNEELSSLRARYNTLVDTYDTHVANTGILQSRLDFYEARCTVITTKLNIAAQIILDAMKVDDDPYKPRPRIAVDLDNAITETPATAGAAVPAFIRRGPNTQHEEPTP